MKRERDEETTVRRSMVVQVARFHTQVFNDHHKFRKLTKQLAEIDQQMEALIKSSGILIASKYRTNTLNYFRDITANPVNAEATYLQNCYVDCLVWPEAFQRNVTNLYLMTIQLAKEALSINPAPQLPTIIPSKPVQSEKSASENWLDDIDFTLII